MAETLFEPTLWLLAGAIVVLAVASAIGLFLKRRADLGLDPGVLQSFNLRIRAWWLMCAILAASLIFGHVFTVVLFGLMSFWALREFITLTPTRAADHRALFYVFFVFTPLQYVFVGLGSEWYGLYTILIPVYAVLFVQARIAIAGDFRHFLERTAKIQAGLMICVYCLSHAPALLTLEIKTLAPAMAQIETDPPAALSDGEPAAAEVGGSQAVAVVEEISYDRNARLLFFFLLVVQMGDVFEFVWDKALGKRLIAPMISRAKTWEGLIGGTVTATLLGTMLWWATPFAPWLAALMSMLICVMGFAGGLTMSAIKRDRGVEDYGTLIQGHGGVLDRLDSICFAAPVFFHVTRYLSEQGWLTG